jgi:hypothetical protein
MDTVLSTLLDDLGQRYADIPGFTIAPHHKAPERALNLETRRKFSTINWHRTPAKQDRWLEVYLSAGPLGWNGPTYELEVAHPDFLDQLYKLLDGHFRNP